MTKDSPFCVRETKASLQSSPSPSPLFMQRYFSTEVQNDLSLPSEIRKGQIPSCKTTFFDGIPQILDGPFTTLSTNNSLFAELVRFYELCRFEKDFEAAREIMMALLPLTTVIESGGKFAQAVKYCVEFEGLPAGPVRPPMRALKKEQKRALREVMETAKISLQAAMRNKKTKKDKTHVKLVK